MPQAESQARANSPQEPFLTIQISRQAGWVALAALVLIGILVWRDLYRDSGHPAPALQITPETQPPRAAPVNAVAPKVIEAKVASPKLSAEPPAEQLPLVAETPEAVRELPPQPAPAEPQVALLPVLVPTSPMIPVSEPGTLNGAGATSPYPLYAKWFNQYHELHPEVELTYQPLGSGAGIRQILAGTVDFGASDTPMSDEQLAATKGRILHVPTVLTAVVPIYNIPGVNRELRFTPEVLAGIYLGKITSWRDPQIARVNPGVDFLDQPILVVHRSDGNSTTLIFTDYLSKVSEEWRKGAGKGTSVAWPVGLGCKGDEGVSGCVRASPGSIGYVDLRYAQENALTFCSVRNAAGVFVKASPQSVRDAAASVRQMPPDFRASITNAPGAQAYPVASFTWFLVPEESKEPAKARNLMAFLSWMLTDGQNMTQDFVPLPKKVAAQARQTLGQVH